MTKPSFPDSFLIFGCGNMGGAMLRGWIAAGIAPERFTVIDPAAQNLPAGVRQFASAASVGGRFGIVLLGIKPQLLSQLAGDLLPLLAPNTLLISILAGAHCSSIAAAFPGSNVVRLMPNLAAEIGKSPLGLYSATLSIADRHDLDAWLAPLGLPIWLDDEAKMDAVTSLVGSGPAFVFRFIGALGAAGATLGLDQKQAMALATAMVEGAALLAAGADENPQELAARVTSPGGTTAAGLAELDRDAGLTNLIENTLRAARDRGIELGKVK
jgi:pyrroline-5-carboxylate reductase